MYVKTVVNQGINLCCYTKKKKISEVSYLKFDKSSIIIFNILISYKKNFFKTKSMNCIFDCIIILLAKLHMQNVGWNHGLKVSAIRSIDYIVLVN